MKELLCAVKRVPTELRLMTKTDLYCTPLITEALAEDAGG